MQFKKRPLVAFICFVAIPALQLQAHAACPTETPQWSYYCDGQAPVTMSTTPPNRLAVYNFSGPFGGPFVPPSGSDIVLSNSGVLTLPSTASDVTAVGMFAEQRAGGATTVISNGAITARNGGIGIVQWRNAFDAKAESNAPITLNGSAGTGISVLHHGFGNIEVNNRADISGTGRGILTTQPGSGKTDINLISGNIRTTGNGVHIDNLYSYAGLDDPTVGVATVDIASAASVDGNVYGIFASTRRAANVVVKNKGSVIGGNNGLTAAVGLQGNTTYAGAASERLELTNTGTIEAKVAASNAVRTVNAGLDLVNDGTITGTIQASPVSVADNLIKDTVKMRAGSVTGNVSLFNGDDEATWSGGTYAGVFNMGNGSDTLTVSTANISSVAAVLDGGDDLSAADGMVDVLRINGVSATMQAANLLNWENIVLDASAVSFADAALAVGADPGTGLFLTNTSTVNVGAVFALTGNMDIAAGSAFNTAGGGGGQFQASANVVNAGTVSLADGAVGDTFAVAGSYTGNGGTLALDTNGLVADTLTVKSTIAGSAQTQLKITAQGAGGATQGPGILVVKVTDGVAGSWENAFTMAPFTLGSFTYSLVRDASDGNWYLQSKDGTVTPPQPPKGTQVVPATGPAAWGFASLSILLAAAGLGMRRRKQLRGSK